MASTTTAGKTWGVSDSRRDAERYHRLLLALRRATGEIKAMEADSPPDIDEVLSRLLPDLANALTARQAFVAMVRTDGTGKRPRFELAAVHPKADWRGQKLDGSELLWQLVEDGKPKIIDPLGEPAPAFVPGLELFKATAAILVRMQAGDRIYVVGVCNKAEGDSGPFLAADGMALDHIVELVAIGARVGERRRRELESLQKTSAVISAQLDLDELLPTITKEAAQVFGAAATSLMLWDEKGENLVIKAKWGLSDEYARQQRIPGHRIYDALKAPGEIRPLVTPDLQQAPFGNLELIKRESLRTVLIAPLLAGSQLTGVLNIYSKNQPRQFGPDEQDLAQIFANQAAIAVKNAALYTGAQSRAQQLQDVLTAGQNITALRPIRDVLQAITDSLVANFGYDAVTLFPYQAESKTFEPPVISGHLRFPSIVQGKVTGDALVEKRLSGPEFYFTANSANDALLAGQFTQRENIQASGYVRLTMGRDVVGILFVNHRTPHTFTEAEQTAVRLFANQAAIAIHNTRQFEAVQNQLDQLEMALAASQGIVMQRPLRETLQAILDQLVTVEGYDIATLTLYRPVRGAFGHTLVAGQLRNYPKGIGRLRQGSVAAQRLTKGPDELFTSDATNDPLLGGSFVKREGIHAVGSIRLKHGQQVVGLLFANKRRPHQFTARERESLRLYASQAALALHEARLFHRSQERLEVLIRIGQQIGQSLQLTLIDTLYEQLRTIFGPDTHPHVLLYDEANQVLRFQHSDRFKPGDRRDQVTLKMGQGLCGVVAETKQPRNVADVRADPTSYLPMLPITRSKLAVPILLGERLVGVLDLESPTPGKFSEDDQYLLEAVAHQVAAAIRNAEQYERLERWRKRLLALHESTKIITASLERDRTLQAILAEAARLTGADVVTIQEKRGDQLYFEAIYPPEKKAQVIRQIGPAMPLNGPGITVRVANTGQPCLKNNVHEATVFVDGTEGRTQSELAVPLLEEGRVRGVLNAEHSERGAFDADDVQVLTALAGLAVVALQNAERYERLEKNRQQLSALHQAGATIVKAGLEIEAVLQAILEQAVAVTGANFGTIQLLRGEMLEFVAAWPSGRLAWLQRKIGRLSLNGPGITVRAINLNDAQLVPDVSQDPDFVDATGETRSELAVVLRRGGRPQGQLIGVLNVEHKQIGGFNREDRDLLIALSNLAVVAIQNAEQYKELEEAKDSGLASQAVAWLGLFGADWQHTINQKTFSIRTYIDGLRRQMVREAVPVRLIDMVQEALEGIEKVTESIRTVPFVERVPTETPDEATGQTLIDAELEKTVSRWCNGQKNIRKIFDLNCPQISVRIPAQWLRVAMEKLINNALKAMPGGGELTVTTQQIEGLVHITVQDTGQGLPDFARADFLKRAIRAPAGNQRSGTGNGALIARFVARSYGGDLSLVYSYPGQGTKLLMTLPVVTEQPRRDE